MDLSDYWRKPSKRSPGFVEGLQSDADWHVHYNDIGGSDIPVKLTNQGNPKISTFFDTKPLVETMERAAFIDRTLQEPIIEGPRPVSSPNPMPSWQPPMTFTP